MNTTNGIDIDTGLVLSRPPNYAVQCAICKTEGAWRGTLRGAVIWALERDWRRNAAGHWVCPRHGVEKGG